MFLRCHKTDIISTAETKISMNLKAAIRYIPILKSLLDISLTKRFPKIEL